MKKKLIALAIAVAVLVQGGVVTKTFSVQTQAVNNTDAIHLSKTISEVPDENGNYTITLESYTTGAVTMGEVGNPLDIVLVLDQSSSMMEVFPESVSEVGANTLQQALKNAASNFVDSVHENGETCGLNHRMAIVTFARKAQIVKEFEDVGNDIGYATIKNAILDLPDEVSGTTGTHDGMSAVKTLLDSDPYEGTEDRDKIIVLFSDGQPTLISFADIALRIAAELKQQEDAVTFYTIGTFPGADPSLITGAATANVGAAWKVESKNEDVYIANRFMNYLSSNSSDANETGLTFSGVGSNLTCEITTEFNWQNEGYYCTATNYQELDQMFDNISSNVTIDAPSLDETAKLKDFLSPYFVFPDGFTSGSITLQTSACTGVDENGTYQWAAPVPLAADSGVTAYYDQEAKSISVTGFDYADQVVTTTSKSETQADFGQKLIVSFLVKAKDGFLGGNEAVSNKNSSGIYTQEDESLKLFDVPYTDVAISGVPITTNDYSIYLGNAVNSGDAVSLVSNPFDGINNAYVNAQFAIYCDENANGVLDDSERANAQIVEIPAGSTVDALSFHNLLTPQTNAQYFVEETITPVYGGSKQPYAEVVDDFWIYVLVPSVTVQDVWVDYGVPVPLSQYCIKDIAWQYISAVPDGAPEPITQAPTVSFVSSPVVEDDVYIATGEKTFTVQALQWQSTDGINTPITFELDEDAQKDFTVHLNLCNLMLTKTVDATSLSAYPQTFFFVVSQGERSFCVSMTAQELESGTCSKSVLGLYAGQSINVTEDGAWAWRYRTDNLPATVLHQNLTEGGQAPLISTTYVPVGEKTLGVNNTLVNTCWLSTEQTVVNPFNGTGDCT